jgi:hypothetical protein
MSDADPKSSDDTKPYAELGKRLKRARKSVKVHGRLLTAEEVGDSLGPEKRKRITISRWESGANEPPPRPLYSYLQVLMQHGLPEQDAADIFEFAHPGLTFMPRRDNRPLLDKSFLLMTDYPRRFESQLQKTKKISVLGTNLRRLIKWRTHIEDIITRGGRVEAILVDPDSDAARYSAFQEHGDMTTLSVSSFVNHLDNCCQWLREQQTKENNRFYDQVEIKKIDYPLAYGLDALDFGNGDGVIYIRFYPLMLGEGEHDRPIIEFTKQSEDWHGLFETQWVRHFSKAASWNAPRPVQDK